MKRIAVLALLIATPTQAQNSGNQMLVLSKKIHICLDREALTVAPKQVDLETATVAIMARCSKQLQEIRNFIYTGIPNFTPNVDFWEKDIEPTWLKEARKKIALARTRDAPVAKPKPALPAPQNNKNQI